MPSTGFTDAEPVEPKASSGAFFWVLHTFKPDGAAGFWGKIGPALGDPAKVEADMPAVWKTFAAIMMPLDAFLKETKIEPPPSDSWW